jgi:hypothetical protein
MTSTPRAAVPGALTRPETHGQHLPAGTSTHTEQPKRNSPPATPPDHDLTTHNPGHPSRGAVDSGLGAPRS